MGRLITIYDFYKAAESLSDNQRLIFKDDCLQAKNSVNRFLQTPKQYEMNQKTWRVFRSVVNEAYSPTVVERFSLRYRVNFNYAIASGKPLTQMDIISVGVGAGRVLVEDLKDHLQGQEIHQLSRKEITRILKEVHKDPFIGPKVDPKTILGGARTFRELFYRNHFIHDQNRQYLSADVDLLHDPNFEVPSFAYDDRLGKVFTSFELRDGEIIPAPFGDYFVVHKKIGTGHGLVAYALKPLTHDSNLSPTIIFRASQVSLGEQDAWETWFNNTQKKMGLMGYRAAKPIFKKLLEDVNFTNNKKIRIIAYSLGATQAQRFLIDYWRNVHEAILLNGPSIDDEAAKRFSDEINNLDHSQGCDEPLIIRIFRNRGKTIEEGDVSDYLGETHLGHGIKDNPFVKVYGIEFKNCISVGQIGKLLGPHANRMKEPGQIGVEMTRYSTQEELDSWLKNEKREKVIREYEKKRLFWGSEILYNALYVLFFIVRGILHLLRIPLLRSSLQANN